MVKTSNEKMNIKLDELAKIILVGSDQFTKSMSEKEEFSNEVKASIKIESVIFLLHYADRVIYSHLGNKQRNSIMDNLLLEILKLLDLSPQATKIFSDLYGIRQKEYSSYFAGDPGKRMGLKGTLHWEFGKIIAETMEKPKSEYIAYAEVSIALVMRYFLNPALKF